MLFAHCIILYNKIMVLDVEYLKQFVDVKMDA